MGNGIYLFCFTRHGLLPAIERTGMDGKNPVFLRRFQDVVAVLCRVAPEEFCGPSAESRMKDLSWVGPRACRHEEVVEEVMRYCPVLPARFGTIFSSMGSLEKRLKEHHGAISQFLDEVADKEEWAVKGLVDTIRAKEELLSTMLAGEAEHLSSLSPGMRYFKQQRLRAGADKELNRLLKETCKGVANDLGRYASDFSEHRVLSRDATGLDMDMVLNRAFLVPRDSADDFRARLGQANADCERHGLVFQLSGPCPPYSFCPSLETESGA